MLFDRGSATKFTLVLPVLFYEYLALSISKSVLPFMIISAFGDWSYFMVGLIETGKGILSFLACPFFGKLSDEIGRKRCLLFTVVGTTFPVCVMAFTDNMWLFAFLLVLSGFFTATFPLTFAYISDCVEKKERAPAYGLALATFGLSFCIGPISGGYLSTEYGNQAVFLCSLLLVLTDVLYITLYLPETVPQLVLKERMPSSPRHTASKDFETAMELLPNAWSFRTTFRVFNTDPFMRNVALIIFLYYTSVWAVVSTLMLYVTKRLHFSAVTMGWLLTVYGLATMFSEGVLVRIIVPRIGEMHAIRLGLLSFAIQCTVLAFSTTEHHIFISVVFSMFANLVYPSMSSLVSKIVDEETQGEAQGALNGIRSLTEGFGPLLFGGLMAVFEGFPVPGAPYLIAAFISLWAFLHSYELPDEPTALAYVVEKYKSPRDVPETVALLCSELIDEDDDEDE